MPQSTLEGRVAVVTGSGRNIGRAIALALAERGADVVLVTRASQDKIERVADEARALGVRALPVLADVGRADQVARLAEQALAEFAKVDILVNNAAVRPAKRFLDLGDDDWHRVIDVDLNGPYYTAKAFLPGMVAQGWGRIINFTGMMAIEGHAGRAVVSAAKFGVWGLTKALAKEYGADGVTVNAVSPGPIDTERDARPPQFDEVLQHVPAGRFGRPEEVASLCAYLATDEAAYVSGQHIGVNGGSTFSLRHA